MTIAIYPGSTIMAAASAVRAVLDEIREHGCVDSWMERMMTLRQYHDVLRFAGFDVGFQTGPYP